MEERKGGRGNALDRGAAGGEKISAREKRNRGEGEMDFPQGLVRKFRKLQGPFCKASISH
jgi:hypothetical protein